MKQRSEDVDARGSYVEALRRRVRTPVRGPAATAWDDHLRRVAENLRTSFGSPPATVDLAPEVLGVIERDGYAIERLTFQSRPGVRVTANLYRPRGLDAPAPGVLCVHGHWKWARIDPGVQARCIGLAKLGYVCLCVDAFGAGERAITPGPGTYHGGPTGASTWAAGVPLIGLQVFDNRRAVDYLTSRPEVDPTRLAITGASGGGNQTLYAGALDDRLKAVVPVCGVGTYESYLGAACCVCEVNPGGMTYACTGDLLAMIAPRALLVVSASRDARQFSAAEAARSLDYARSRFESLDAAGRVRHVVVDSDHDYNQTMREAMYGWLDLWLRDKGDGSPASEPAFETEEPSLLRCYADSASRPPAVATIPAFVHAEARTKLEALPAPPDHLDAWETLSPSLRDDLNRLLGGVLATAPRVRTTFDGAGSWSILIEPEPGISLRGAYQPPSPETAATGLTILADDGDDPKIDLSRDAEESRRQGSATCIVELRALGRLKPQTEPIAGAIDHNEAEWGVWLGRPLLGRWVHDLLCWVDALSNLTDGPPKLPDGLPVTIRACGATGTAALLAAGLSPRIQAVRARNALVRQIGPKPTAWGPVRMGLIVPNLLSLGDFGRIAALAAPRRLEIIDGREADGSSLNREELSAAFAYAREIYRLYDSEAALRLG